MLAAISCSPKDYNHRHAIRVLSACSLLTILVLCVLSVCFLHFPVTASLFACERKDFLQRKLTCQTNSLSIFFFIPSPCPVVAWLCPLKRNNRPTKHSQIHQAWPIVAAIREERESLFVCGSVIPFLPKSFHSYFLFLRLTLSGIKRKQKYAINSFVQFIHSLLWMKKKIKTDQPLAVRSYTFLSPDASFFNPLTWLCNFFVTSSLFNESKDDVKKMKGKEIEIS